MPASLIDIEDELTHTFSPEELKKFAEIRAQKGKVSIEDENQ
jgi:hypothetical protein